MSKYVIVYKGGSAAPDEAGRKASMDRWGKWMQELGGDLVDGGNPFTSGKSVSADGKTGEATSGLSGYSIVNAGSFDDAVTKAKDCPIFQDGGTIDVYETMEM